MALKNPNPFKQQQQDAVRKYPFPQLWNFPEFSERMITLLTPDHKTFPRKGARPVNTEAVRAVLAYILRRHALASKTLQHMGEIPWLYLTQDEIADDLGFADRQKVGAAKNLLVHVGVLETCERRITQTNRNSKRKVTHWRPTAGAWAVMEWIHALIVFQKTKDETQGAFLKAAMFPEDQTVQPLRGLVLSTLLAYGGREPAVMHTELTEAMERARAEVQASTEVVDNSDADETKCISSDTSPASNVSAVIQSKNVSAVIHCIKDKPINLKPKVKINAQISVSEKDFEEKAPGEPPQNLTDNCTGPGTTEQTLIEPKPGNLSDLSQAKKQEKAVAMAVKGFQG